MCLVVDSLFLVGVDWCVLFWVNLVLIGDWWVSFLGGLVSIGALFVLSWSWLVDSFYLIGADWPIAFRHCLDPFWFVALVLVYGLFILLFCGADWDFVCVCVYTFSGCVFFVLFFMVFLCGWIGEFTLLCWLIGGLLSAVFILFFCLCMSGFVIVHDRFLSLFCRYLQSHFVPAFEILLLLIVSFFSLLNVLFSAVVNFLVL